MGTVLQKRAARNTQKNTRRVADRHRKRCTIYGSSIIKANWDKRLTVKQNYEKLGLATNINGESGGAEKKYPKKQQTEEPDNNEPVKELSELTEEEVAELKKKLGPGEGLIQRDDEGNVVRIIVGEAMTHDEILDQEFAPVEAKTDVVRQLEEQASKVYHRERNLSEFEADRIKKLIDKHGDDYKAMFWDKELNEYQHTVNQLKKKCQQYLKEYSQ
ncbi:ribosome biogenesis protein Nop16 [Cokeromyces recurvatus]|uniref:ribosome biogenesis protein Nop16 n=1 Tax=Cokeromyces recurvatus TaxID=90255 RepID=UPI002221005C|nr:ribosome biogenesis protein Nop16 [Cokeromyces recurvatus]KAI7898251.1 ribosome biogenesis protein Nop16 [Cokeromyces recurvatus]